MTIPKAKAQPSAAVAVQVGSDGASQSVVSPTAVSAPAPTPTAANPLPIDCGDAEVDSWMTASPALRKACALYSECPTMCRIAMPNAPSPHSSIMKPICASVEYAREPLIVVCVSMTIEPKIAVAAPTAISAVMAIGWSTIRSAKRRIRNPPELIIPAWSSAETGVGVSITSGTQAWNGIWADLRKCGGHQQPDGDVHTGRHRRLTLCCGGDRRDVRRAECLGQQHRGAQETDVGQPRSDHLLATGDHRPRSIREEDQQPVQREARGHPGDDQLREVPGQHQQHHRRQREAERSREVSLPPIARQVAARVSHHHQAHERDEREHRRAQPIEPQREPDAFDAQGGARAPSPEEHGGAGEHCDREAGRCGDLGGALDCPRGIAMYPRSDEDQDEPQRGEER